MNELAVRAAAHEASHVVAAILLDWDVTGVERGRDLSGLTHLDPRTDGDVLERGTELGVILWSAVEVEPEGAVDDLTRVAELVQSGVKLSTVIERTRELHRTPRFRTLKGRVETALLRHPTLTREDLEAIRAGER